MKNRVCVYEVILSSSVCREFAGLHTKTSGLTQAIWLVESVWTKGEGIDFAWELAKFQ